MASLWEPPALLTLVVVLGGGAGVIYHALRPALRGPHPVVTSERDEVWGVDDPPPPPKRPYVYPTDLPEIRAAVQSEPEPCAVMPGGPTVAPLLAVAQPRIAPVGIDEDEDEELSLADLFRPTRRSPAAPNDAPTQD
jgi:hypothetical protein